MNLETISLNITESEYRDLPALNYTRIKRYMTEGFSSLYTTTKPSASLAFGSLIDTLVTSPQEFHDKYTVLSGDDFTDKEKEILDYVYEQSEHAPTVKDIDSITIKMACGLLNKNWKIETREQKIVELLNDKYMLYLQAQGKTILSQADYESAIDCANKVNAKLESLKHSGSMFFQLKFQQTISDIDYKCMFDMLWVDYQRKYILPLDLKTTSEHEYDFPKAFIKYMYYIQAELYTAILKKAIENTEFKDFKILPFSFIVINNIYREPLFWKYNLTYEQKAQLPDFSTAAKELYALLRADAKLPLGVTENSFNSLSSNIKL